VITGFSFLSRVRPFRDEAESGSGGGGDTSAASSAGGDRVAQLESRLNRVMGAVEKMASQTKAQETNERIGQQERALEAEVSEAQKKIDAAEAKLAQEYDTGDGASYAKAQRELAEAIAKKERADLRLDNHKAAVERMKKTQSGEEAGKSKNLDTTNLNNWRQRHASWYGIDQDMTRAAHEIHRQIEADAVQRVGSKEYFDEIDKRMAQRFPDKFSGSATTPDTASGAGRAAASGQGKSRAGRIPEAVADSWRRMGIKVDDPKVVERMLNHRQKLVDKGVLPSEMVRDRVVQR